MRDISWGAFYWQIYTSMINHFNKNKTEKSFKSLSLCGGISGCIASLIATPFDLIKTVQQVNRDKSVSFLHICKVIVKNDGFMALFRGTGPRMFKQFPQSAISISSYELGKKIFKKYSKNTNEN